jgi:hypothetical protein
LANGLQLSVDDLRRQEIEEDIAKLELNRRSGPAAKADAPPPRKPDAVIPGLADDEDLGLGFQGEDGPKATFTDLFLKNANIGPGGVSYEEIKREGGIAGIMGKERLKTPGVRELNDVLSAMLGETTGTQRAAPDRKELSPWQKGLLFVADVTAAFEGRVPPSQQLDQQLWKSLTLQDQMNQERYLKGIDAINKFSEMIDKLPLEARIRAAAQQAPRMRKDFGEGFGANLILLASEPSKKEAWDSFSKNIETYKDGASDTLMKYVTYLIGSGDTDAAHTAFSQYGFGTKGNPGVFEMDAMYAAPALMKEKLDGFIGELRNLGGSYAELATKIDAEEKISPSEIVNANNALPVGSPFKLDGAVIRTLQMEPERFAAVLPGMVTAEQKAAEQVAMNDAERSVPITFIGGPESDAPGRMETAPGLSKRAAWLMENGYDRADAVMDKLAGLGGGMSDSNLIRLGSDFMAESKSFETTKMAYKKILAASREPNAPGNVSMIFAFMKSLDPGSVVREGEQETARKARSRIDDIKTWVSRNIKGNQLTPTQVEQFVRIAKGIYGEVAHEQALREQRWVKRLDGLNIPRDLHGGIIVDLIGNDREMFGLSGEDNSELKRVLDRYQ